jgi:hypothetical protein
MPMDDAMLAALLRTLDHQPPAIDADAVMARARVATAHARRRRRAIALAASGSTLLAAALAAALPSSPLGQYLRTTLGHRRVTAQPKPPPVPATAQTQTVTGGGVAITPPGDVRVVFRTQQAAGDIRITFGPDPLLRVALVGGGTPAYTIAQGAVTVENTGSRSSYQLTLPASVRHARVVVAADTVFAADGHRIRTSATPDGDRRYVFYFVDDTVSPDTSADTRRSR